MVMPLIASAGGSALSAGIGGALDVWGAKSAARDQFMYQKALYKKRYQWQVKDMKKAGLNPMLAFSQGAPVPGGVQAPDMGKIGSRAVSAYQAAQLQKAEIANIGANTNKAVAETGEVQARTANLEADTALKSTTTAKTAQETKESVARVDQIAANIGEIAARVNKLTTENAQLSEMLRLEREVKAATAASLNAGVPPKVLLGEIAQIGTDLVRELKTPKAKSQANALIRDTANMIEDKIGHAKNSAKGLWEGAKRGYSDFMKRHGSAYR